MVTEIDVNDDFTLEVFVFLDGVRESGRVNMFGAAPVLTEAYGMEQGMARKFLGLWMETFSDRHPELR